MHYTSFGITSRRAEVCKARALYRKGLQHQAKFHSSRSLVENKRTLGTKAYSGKDPTTLPLELTSHIYVVCKHSFVNEACHVFLPCWLGLYSVHVDITFRPFNIVVVVVVENLQC